MNVYQNKIRWAVDKNSAKKANRTDYLNRTDENGKILAGTIFPADTRQTVLHHERDYCFVIGS